MTFKRVDSVWISESDETDCPACTLRYFLKCPTCEALVCSWCDWEMGLNRPMCTKCFNKSVGISQDSGETK